MYTPIRDIIPMKATIDHIIMALPGSVSEVEWEIKCSNRIPPIGAPTIVPKAIGRLE